jgi:hypothetical protein
MVTISQPQCHVALTPSLLVQKKEPQSKGKAISYPFISLLLQPLKPLPIIHLFALEILHPLIRLLLLLRHKLLLGEFIVVVDSPRE